MRRLLFALISITVLISCNSTSTNKIFKPEAIASQLFTINIAKDTILRTKQGAVISIPKGALQSANSTVQLEIKEAYHISEMIRAGLTTQSNGQLLSSGGMIFIDAVGETTVKITQALKVSIPSNFINNDMELFKGEKDDEGNLNWTNPSPIRNVNLPRLATGKAMFNSKCSSCHLIHNDYPTALQADGVKENDSLYKAARKNQAAALPASCYSLAHISKRRDKEWLFAFTRNCQAILASGDQLANCVFQQCNHMPMNIFPELTDDSMEVLYEYIEHVSDSSRIPLPQDITKDCLDSCNTYLSLRTSLLIQKDKLTRDNDGQVKEDRTSDTSTPSATPALPAPALPPVTLTPIDPVNNEGLFYQFTIESFGWYNVDLLIKSGPGMIESNLMVRIQGQYRERVNVYLIIPSVRAFTAAGKLPGEKNEYVFAETDGKIFLPEGAKAYIIVMGDREDDILLTKTEFVVQKNNNFTLTPAIVTKEQFNFQMSQLNFEQLNISVKKSKNADELRKTVRDLTAAEQLRPKNCDCDCGMMNKSDTAISEMYYLP